MVEATNRTLRALTANGKLLRKLGFNAVSVSWQPTCTRSGGPRADRLAGTARSELICGLGGAGRITGGRGRDRLFGGDGNDTIHARDGTFDVVGCGPGRDIVAADRIDALAAAAVTLTSLRWRGAAGAAGMRQLMTSMIG